MKPKNITVRKVTRGSPDSDDSFVDDSPENYLGGRDDQFLVSDRSENKFYGNVNTDLMNFNGPRDLTIFFLIQAAYMVHLRVALPLSIQ